MSSSLVILCSHISIFVHYSFTGAMRRKIRLKCPTGDGTGRKTLVSEELPQIFGFALLGNG